MDVMEIQNREEIRPIINQIELGFRTSAPAAMWFITSKAIVFFIANIWMIFLFVPATWNLLTENKVRKETNDRMFLTRSQNAPANVNLNTAQNIQMQRF
jgi:hypothetical protein